MRSLQKYLLGLMTLRHVSSGICIVRLYSVHDVASHWPACMCTPLQRGHR